MKLKNWIFLACFIISTSEACIAQKNTTVVKEDFTEFIYQFSADSVFQLSRIDFPLTFVSLDYQFEGEDTTYISKDKWDFDPTYFDGQNISRIQFYYSFDLTTPDTDQRVINIIGISDGVNIRYYFESVLTP